MNNQEINPLKDYTNQQLVGELIKRIKTDPPDPKFISEVKTILPILQLLVGEKPNLANFADQELADELTKRINNFSLNPICLLYPLVVAGSQYLNWYNAEKSRKKPTE